MHFFRSTQYHPIASEDLEDASGQEKASQNPRLPRSVHHRVISVVLLVIVSFALWLLWSRHRASVISDLPCGTTATEARARGCIFEMTGSSWVSPECYDSATEQEFLAFKQWKFYEDYNYTREVPLAEVRLGEGNGYFVSHDYHQTHCAFLLKKLHRAVNHGKPVDGLIKQISHTDHCISWMLNPPKNYFDMPQFAYTKFPNCGKEGGFNLDGSVLKPPARNGVTYIDAHLDHSHGSHQHT